MTVKHTEITNSVMRLKTNSMRISKQDLNKIHTSYGKQKDICRHFYEGNKTKIRNTTTTILLKDCDLTRHKMKLIKIMRRTKFLWETNRQSVVR